MPSEVTQELKDDAGQENGLSLVKSSLPETIQPDTSNAAIGTDSSKAYNPFHLPNGLHGGHGPVVHPNAHRESQAHRPNPFHLPNGIRGGHGPVVIEPRSESTETPTEQPTDPTKGPDGVELGSDADVPPTDSENKSDPTQLPDAQPQADHDPVVIDPNARSDKKPNPFQLPRGIHGGHGPVVIHRDHSEDTGQDGTDAKEPEN